MRVLFTGASSLAGRRLFGELRRQGHDVVGISRGSLPDAVESFQVDLEAEDAAKRLPDERFDALVHFASFVPLNERESDWSECYSKNVCCTARLLEWADGRVGRILFASSCAVYGAEKVYTPTDEAHPLRPDTAYALSKYGQEQLLQAFCRSRNIPLTILRLGYVYGPDMDANRAVTVLARRVAEGLPITLRNPRSGLHLIHQDDIASIGATLLSEGSGVYNLAGDRHITLTDYVETAMRVVGRRTHIVVEDPDGPVFNHYSCRRLQHRHGIRPRVTLEAGIASLLPKTGDTAGRASEGSR